MAATDRPAVFVHLLPGLIPPGALEGAVAVVVDVLRATTVMVQALAAGCEAVIPCSEIDEALRARASRPPGTVLLAGERHGLPIDGFDLGNSPGDFTPEACLGKTLVMTTTNGTRAILASRAADRVLIAAFSNLSPTVKALSGLNRPVHVVCSGTEGRISFEDTLLAGVLVRRLRRESPPGDPTSWDGNDETEIAAGLDAKVVEGVERGRPLADFLSLGRGGRRVREIGLAADIDAAARIDRFELVAELRRDPLRVVRAG
jgi:2-phosphosulfolactate phosphatase